MNIVIGFVLAGLIFGGALLALLWNGDERVPPAVRLRLPGTGGHAGQRAMPEVFGHTIDRVFGTDAFSLRFILTAILLSLFSFLLFFATYLLKIPDFASSLLEDSYQRGAVGKQLLTMFIPANAVICYLSLAYCREAVMQMEHADGTGRLWVPLLKDLVMKLVVVALAIALIYLVLVGRGAFDNSSKEALEAVPGVFLGALTFGNLNCVYIYSSLVTSVWLWAWLIAGRISTSRHLPRAFLHDRYPVRALAAQAGVITALLYWAVAILT